MIATKTVACYEQETNCTMGKYYTYLLTLHTELRRKGTVPKYPESLDEVKEYLEEGYSIDETCSNYVRENLGCDPMDWSKWGEEKAEGDFFEASFDFQFTFPESEVLDGEEPTSQALESLEDELTEHLSAKYEVRTLEVLDDTLSSCLLGVDEDDEGGDECGAAACGGRVSPRRNAEKDAIVAAIRQVFSAGGPRHRQAAIREVFHLLPGKRLTKRVREEIESALTAAAHRGIVRTEDGLLYSDCRKINDYPRELLKKYLVGAMKGSWWEEDEAIRAAARHLGFRKASPKIQAEFRSAIRGALRQGSLEREGTMIRRAR